MDLTSNAVKLGPIWLNLVWLSCLFYNFLSLDVEFLYLYNTFNSNKVPVTEHFFIFNRMVFHKLGLHTHLWKRNHLVCRLTLCRHNVLLPTAQRY